MPKAVEWRIEGGGQGEHYPGAHRSTSISSLTKKRWVTSAWKWLGWWELNLRIFTGSHSPKWMFRLMTPGSGGLQDSLGSCWYVICEWYQWQNIIKATSPRLQTSDHRGSWATHFMGGHKYSVRPSYWKLWWRTRRTWCPVASFLSAVCCWKSLPSLLQTNVLWNWASQGAPGSCVPRVKLAHQTAGCNRKSAFSEGPGGWVAWPRPPHFRVVDLRMWMSPGRERGPRPVPEAWKDQEKDVSVCVWSVGIHTRSSAGTVAVRRRLII